MKYMNRIEQSKRKKYSCFFRSFLILAAALLMSGCENRQEYAETETQMQTDQAQQITFTDDLGRKVSIQRPKRVIAMIGSFADVWNLAGGEDTLAGTANDAWTSFELDLGEDVVDIGAVKEPNLEMILAAEPDLILGSVKTASNLELMETFEQAGITAAYFDVNGFGDYLRMLKICTDLTGHPECYEKNGLQVQQQIQTVLERKTEEFPTVLTIRATGSSCKVKNSTGTVMGEILYDLGCVNIADSDTTLLENLSMESIIAADPDYIFVVLQGADSAKAEQTVKTVLLSNPVWSHLRAVQEEKFYVMEHRLYNLKPNARWGEAYEKLADILYPKAE